MVWCSTRALLDVRGVPSCKYTASLHPSLVLTFFQQAQAMHDRGLAAAGYTFVNSDDCWMLRNRSASGDLVPDPARFPNGWLPITKFIHGLGMKSGLYTSKSEYTCAGFAASCGNEMRDAALFASWECVQSLQYLRRFSSFASYHTPSFRHPFPSESTTSRRIRAEAAAATTLRIISKCTRQFSRRGAR